LSEAKYRQHGYRDGDRHTSRERPASDRPVKQETFGPRAMQMAATHSVSRCSQCGALLTSPSEPVGRCAKCGFDLHSCKQCAHFDTSARFECSQPIPLRIPRKDQLNQCELYAISVRFEKQTSTPPASRPHDARQAFENLFKK
jgi:hypothetical protein